MTAISIFPAEEGAPMILAVDHVTKRFGGLVAVDDVSVGLEEGMILGLIGPNGAGKTTLFNCITGVYPPTSGSVVFRDKEIAGSKPYTIARLGLARTHQIVRPLNDLAARDNVIVGACYGRENRGLRGGAQVADEVLEFVGLASRSDELAGKLNVAQKKRLELARALAARPHLLLLDEVLAGLNTAEVTGMLDTIRAIRESGVTILMIEHIMHAVMNLSDRIIVLDYGKLIAEGAPEAVAQNEQVIEAYLGDPDIVEEVTDVDAIEEGPA